MRVLILLQSKMEVCNVVLELRVAFPLTITMVLRGNLRVKILEFNKKDYPKYVKSVCFVTVEIRSALLKSRVQKYAILEHWKYYES